MQMAKTPVIFLTDTPVIVGSIVLAIAGILVVSQRQTNRIKEK
jgi:hypothetical protein